jgi:hypothetical protein
MWCASAVGSGFLGNPSTVEAVSRRDGLRFRRVRQAKERGCISGSLRLIVGLDIVPGKPKVAVVAAAGSVDGLTAPPPHRRRSVARTVVRCGLTDFQCAKIGRSTAESVGYVG